MNKKILMKIGLVCPASLPAVQFGGILFLCVDLAREMSELGHDVTIYTTNLDFANMKSDDCSFVEGVLFNFSISIDLRPYSDKNSSIMTTSNGDAFL